MTTVKEVLDRAIELLGYTDRYGMSDSEQFGATFKTAITAVNTVISDLSRCEHITYVPVTSIDDTVTLSQVSIDDILPYGVAQWLAMIDGDGTNQQMFAFMYNQKRASAPKPYLTVTETIPVR